MPANKRPTTRWTVSFMKFRGKSGMRFKVTRRIPAMGVSETRVFGSKSQAERQLKEWLQ